MQVNMDGLRKNLCRAFNEYYGTLDQTQKQSDELMQVRDAIAMLMCVYDDGDDSFTDLDPDQYLVNCESDQR